MTGPSSSAPPWQSPAFSELRAVYASGRLVLFSGDGVSASAGLPDRKALAVLMAEHARDWMSPEQLRVLHRRIARGRYITAFSDLLEGRGWPTFVPLITETLDANLADESEVIPAIVALAPRLRAVFNTSLDPLLERAFAGRGPSFVPADTHHIPDLPSEPFLLKPHGTLFDPRSWVLKRYSHQRDMFRMAGSEWTRFFQEAPVLFVGYDASDDVFFRLLGRIRRVSRKRPATSFALVPARTLSPSRRKRLEALGVRLIPYDDAEDRYTTLGALLERLASPGEARGTSDSRSTSDGWRTEAGELLARAGFTVSFRQPTGTSPRQEVHFRWLMRSRDVPCAPVWLGRRAGEGPVEDEPLAALLTRSGAGGFTVALHAQALSSSRELLAELARTLPPLGVPVCVYDTRRPTGPWPSGVELLGLREVVAHQVREPLRRHASRCLSAWSEQESRFVETRARFSVSGTVRPVFEALDQTLAACSRVLLLGDFGTGKSTHLGHFAACLARDFLEDREGARAPLLLPLAGLPADLDVLIARHVPELSRPLFRLAVELGLVVSLLDGLDEMTREPLPWQPHPVDPSLLRLRQVFSQDGARTIFSSRGMLFSSPIPIRQGRLLGVPSRGHLSLEPLDGSEVHALVERWAPSRKARARLEERLRSSPHLESLADRPALLELLVKHPELSTARLYALATEAWLGSRDGQEHRVEREPHLKLARELARTLFVRKQEKLRRSGLNPFESDWNRETIHDLARVDFRLVGFLGHSAPTPRLYRQDSDEDPEAEAFDRSEHDLEVRLPNSSFLEYFLVAGIGEALAAGSVEPLERELLPAGACSFVVEQEGWARGRELLRGVLATEYTPEVSENALVLLYQDARTRVGDGEALGRLLADELPVGTQLEGARLEGVELPWVFLREARLSGATLTGARLEFADLRGARLDGAQAEGARFDGALLDRVSFEGARLQRASMLDASVGRVEWEDVDRDELLLLEEGPGEPPRAVLHGRLAPGRVSIAWSPDERRMASGHAGGSVRVWDVVSGKLLLRLEGVQATGVVAFSPDGLLLASECEDGTVRVWDARGGLPRHRLEVHASPVRKVMFSSDGELLFTACEDGTVEAWDMPGGVPRYRLKGSEHRGESVEFSSNGFLACGCTDGTMKVWDADSGKLLHRLEGHAGGVKVVAFSRDGVFLASGSEDGTVRIWNMLSRHRPLQHRLEVGAGAIHTLSSSECGRYLAVGCEDGSVGVWDMYEGTRAHQWGEHASPVRRVRLSPDFWPTQVREEDQVPRFRYVASIGEDRTVRLWDTAGGSRMHRLLEREVEATSLEFSPDGKRLAVGFAEGAVKVWDLESGKVLHAVEAPRRGPRRVVVSPDGKQLACLTGAGAVSVWDVREGRRLHRLEGDSGWVETGLAHGWEARTVALLRRLEDPEGGEEVEVSSPDGERLFSMSAEGLVRVSRRGGETRTVVLADTKDGWVAQVEGTPFVASEGDASRLFHYVGCTGTMPAELWRPLFHRPDLVHEALAGRRVDPEAQGRGSYATCVSALRTERRHLGLERRRGGP